MCESNVLKNWMKQHYLYKVLIDLVKVYDKVNKEMLMEGIENV